ncbi:MAG: response regulator [Chloroflexi bacterium]|nr:response regulator [Chloroflexota bacterium]
MRKPLRVLIVEDSKADAELLLIELEKSGYDPTSERVDTAAGMSEALDRHNWDVILADYVMPRFSGLAALELLQARGIDLPFIVLSGQIGEEIAVATMKAGASDYILKGHCARLIPAIERELREAEVRRQRRKAEEERDRLMEQLREVNQQLVLSNLRTQDQATEMAAFIAAIEEALARYKASGKSPALG